MLTRISITITFTLASVALAIGEGYVSYGELWNAAISEVELLGWEIVTEYTDYDAGMIAGTDSSGRMVIVGVPKVGVPGAEYGKAGVSTIWSYIVYDKFDEGILTNKLERRRVADSIRDEMFDAANVLKASMIAAGESYGDLVKRELRHEGKVKKVCDQYGFPREDMIMYSKEGSIYFENLEGKYWRFSSEPEGTGWPHVGEYIYIYEEWAELGRSKLRTSHEPLAEFDDRVTNEE